MARRVTKCLSETGDRSGPRRLRAAVLALLALLALLAAGQAVRAGPGGERGDCGSFRG